MDNKQVNYKISSNELEFVFFCIESVADKLNLEGKEVYELLTNQSDILDSYIVPSMMFYTRRVKNI